MAALGSQSIASSYEQLLHVDADGGGNSTTHVSVKDGDNGTTFGFTIASDALMMSSTNRLEFGDTGTYIHQSADGVLDLVSDTEIEINATDVDMNGALDLDGTFTQDAGAVVFNEAGENYDFRIESADKTHMLFIDASGNTAAFNRSSADHILDVSGTSNTVASGSSILAVFSDDSMAIDKGGSIGFQSVYSDGGLISENAFIGGFKESNVSGETAGYMVFGTRPDAGSVTERMRIGSTGDVTVSTGDLIFGTAGKGICLGVTSNTDSNTLDDYEEGAWATTGGAVNGITMDVASSSGEYIKIGNQVFLWGLVTFGTHTADGNATYTGSVPFAAKAGTYAYGKIGYTDSGVDGGFVEIRNGETFFRYGKSTGIAITRAESANDYFAFSISYIAA